jgi:hypothetical protein
LSRGCVPLVAARPTSGNLGLEVSYRLLLWLAVTAGLASCYGAYRAEELVTPSIEPGQKRATLVVSRDAQLFGSAVVWTILFDGEPIRNLGSGQEFMIEVPAGVHVVGLVCGSTGILGGSDETTVPFEAGRTYRLHAFGTMNTPCQVQLQAR